MTVKELIDCLNGCDMNARVYIYETGEVTELEDNMIYHKYQSETNTNIVLVKLEGE